MSNKKPIVAVTIGDPGSIGPEIVLKSLINKKDELKSLCFPLIIGDKELINYNIDKLFSEKININILSEEEVGDVNNYSKENINLLDLSNIDFNYFKIGQVSSQNGQASFDYIKKSIELGKKGKIDSVATAPINKESLKAAKIDYIGHTEIYSDLLDRDKEKVITMFEVKKLRTFFLTRHLSLLQAISSISKTKIINIMYSGIDALKSIGINQPRIVVAALNPHGGEGGMFGQEEIEHIIPAVKELKEEGYDISGPIGADSVYHLALRENYDAVLSLYHDQGHIASKMYDFNQTISLTLGLPFLRTSVDHGTAFDLAYKNKAEYTSMYESIVKAAKYGPKVLEYNK